MHGFLFLSVLNDGPRTNNPAEGYHNGIEKLLVSANGSPHQLLKNFRTNQELKQKQIKR